MKYRVLSNLNVNGMTYKAGDEAVIDCILAEKLMKDGIVIAIEEPKPVEPTPTVEPEKPKRRGRKPRK